jgi:cyclophilin family peptidyl-prolyl cis-trans isomerase
MKSVRCSLALGLCMICFCKETQAVPTTNGLYAAFNTSMGTFYCVLRYDLVPRTVGNFVSLADGTKQWLDYSKAAVVQRPFYSELTFHRVVTNFVIQFGSPNGIGTDDPGYRFKDEIITNLNNDSAGVLAMANSGTNSNGSQAYVTLSPQPSLDGHYSVFGQVVEGMNVVSNIGSVATDTNNKPLVPVIITNITILRIGTAASNFNADAVSPPLPNPHIKVAQMQLQAPDLLLLWNQLAGYDYRICYSGDFQAWRGFYVGAFAGRYMDDFRAAFPFQFFEVFETNID